MHVRTTYHNRLHHYHPNPTMAVSRLAPPDPRLSAAASSTTPTPPWLPLSALSLLLIAACLPHLLPQEGSLLSSLSTLLRNETLPAWTEWHGVPVEPIEAYAPYGDKHGEEEESAAITAVIAEGQVRALLIRSIATVIRYWPDQ